MCEENYGNVQIYFSPIGFLNFGRLKEMAFSSISWEKIVAVWKQDFALIKVTHEILKPTKSDDFYLGNLNYLFPWKVSKVHACIWVRKFFKIRETLEVHFQTFHFNCNRQHIQRREKELSAEVSFTKNLYSLSTHEMIKAFLIPFKSSRIFHTESVFLPSNFKAN